MEKKKVIKIVTAMAIAASAFTAVAPAQSEATTSLTSQIKTAKVTIKKPYDTYIKATKKPANLTTVRNQIAAAEKAKTSINAAIKKAKLSTSQKKAKYAEMKAYDQYITRAEGYVTAVSINVKSAGTAFDTAVKGGTAKNVLVAQKALNAKVAQFEKAVAKVYGKATRSLLISYYATPAKKQAVSVATEMKVYIAYNQIESGKLITTDLTKAGQLIDSVKAEAKKLRAKDKKLAGNLVKVVDKNNELYKKALAAVTVVDKAELDKIIADFYSVKEEKYTMESYTAYKTAVDAAKVVKANVEATQAEVDAAVKAVNDSKTALVNKVEETLTITTADAIATNDLALALGAIAYTVEGTISSAHKGEVTELTLTFTNGTDKKDQKVEVKADGTFSHVIAVSEFETWTGVQASYDYKGAKQESSVKTFTPKVQQ